MLSLQSISAVKVAVEICHIPKIKENIFRPHESENYVNENTDSQISKKLLLMETEKIIRSLGISKNLQEQILCLVSRIGRRMLEWTYYHQEILEFPHYYSIELLTPSFFTSRGIIDGKKTAKLLMEAETLTMKQRYILACLYCCVEEIHTLFRNMTDLDKRTFYNARRHEIIQQPEIVKYWTYYQMDNMDKLTNEDVNAYKIKAAVRSGNIAAVEYMLQDMILRGETGAIIEGAMEAIRFWQKKPLVTDDSNAYLNGIKIPRSCFADILCYILSRMDRSQQIEFLKKDIADDKYKRTFLKYKEYSRVLECLLNWPYQDYFINTLSVVWGFLPEWNYALLLLLISREIEDGIEELDGEGKIFDYRRLLREVWCESHERYKMFVLNNEEILFPPDNSIKAGVRLISNLLCLPKFTEEDKEQVEIILADATDKQKENIICSEEWGKICINLIEKEKWGILKRFDLDCFFTMKARAKFKKNLTTLERVKFILFNFFRNNKWESAEFFIQWSSLPDEEIRKLKRDIIYSDRGMTECVSLIAYEGKGEAVERFIAWCISSEEDKTLFKKEMIFSHLGISRCAYLITQNEFELLNEFILLFISSSEEIKELKKKIAYDFGYPICKIIIYDYNEQYMKSNLHYSYDKQISFTGGAWEEVDKFITFCFSSENEIKDYKKNFLLRILGREIHFDLIKSYKWEEAETFFTWLGLSADEVKKLKKETLFYHTEAQLMFMELVRTKKGIVKFVHYGNKYDTIEVLLKWYLTDKDGVLDFKNECKKWYQEFNYDDKNTVLKSLDLIIERQLKDFDKELN